MARRALLGKKEIVKAAFVIFKQKGIEGFKIRNIARTLNTSTSPIYYRFKSIQELQDAMVEEIMELLLAPVKDLERYYTYENLTWAFCLFARNQRKLFESIFLKFSKNSENSIRKQVLRVLREIIEEDENFDYERDYHKLLLVDGIALKIFNSGKKMSEEDIQNLINEYLTV